MRVGAGEEGVRTCMASSVGVRVVQEGPTGMARRLAMGEPLGAIWEGERARVGWALLRVGEVGRVLPPRPPPLPRGWVAPRPLRSRSACALKVTLRLMLQRSFVGEAGEFQDFMLRVWRSLTHNCYVRSVYTV
jgi:hypothetical protein